MNTILILLISQVWANELVSEQDYIEAKKEAVAECNKLGSPEATLSLVSGGDGEVIIEYECESTEKNAKFLNVMPDVEDAGETQDPISTSLPRDNKRNNL